MSTSLRIEIAEDAQKQIAAAVAWWTENRPSAPGAVVEDLDRILGLLVGASVVDGKLNESLGER